MTSPLNAAVGQIITDLEALTPVSETAVGYKHVGDGTAKEIPDGSSAHRCFWFVLVSGGWEHDFGSESTIEETILQLKLRLNTSEYGLTDFLFAQVNEALVIQRTINNRQDWPTGVDIVHCEGYTTERVAGDDYDMIFDLRMRTHET